MEHGTIARPVSGRRFVALVREPRRNRGGQSMETRALGRTGLRVGVIGLGTEYLFHAEQDTVVAVIREALENGVDYFDLLGPMPDYRDHLGVAFRETFRTGRDKVVIAGHLGCDVSAKGLYETTRDPARSERAFHDLLRRLGTDYVDVVNLASVDAEDDYQDKIMGPGGLWELADRLRRQGKARFIAMSGHTEQTGLVAVKSGRLDCLMWPVNMARPPRGPEKVGMTCIEAGVGLVAMKPFFGGEFFQLPYSNFVTPALALSFVLTQPGVVVAVPGAKDVEQLRASLAYVKATEAERDFRSILANFSERLTGTCTYCDHCLPCGADVPISDILWDLRAEQRGSSYARRAYAGRGAKASACTACGECLERCPFGVDIVERLREAARVFEGK